MTRITLTIIYLIVLSLAASALAQNDPNNKVKPDSKQSLLLTAEETNSLDTIKRALQVQNQKEAQASQVIVDTESDNLDAMTLAAIKFRKIAIDGRKSVQGQFQSWLAKVQEAHKCPNCTLAQDEKSLVKPLDPPKPSDK